MIACVALCSINNVRLLLSIIPLPTYSHALVDFREFVVHLVCVFAIFANLLNFHLISKIPPEQLLGVSEYKMFMQIKSPKFLYGSIVFCILLVILGGFVFYNPSRNWKWTIFMEQLILGISGGIIIILVALCSYATRISKKVSISDN